MTGREHIIDVDTLVLNGVDMARAERARALIEAQVAGVLSGVQTDAQFSGARAESGIAGEVARAVIGALLGASNGR